MEVAVKILKKVIVKIVNNHKNNRIHHSKIKKLKLLTIFVFSNRKKKISKNKIKMMMKVMIHKNLEKNLKKNHSKITNHFLKL